MKKFQYMHMIQKYGGKFQRKPVRKRGKVLLWGWGEERASRALIADIFKFNFVHALGALNNSFF